jgi:hypothetical protein
VGPGYFKLTPLAAVANIGGFDIQQGRRTNGGLRDPGFIRVQALGEPIPSTTYSLRDFILPSQGHLEFSFTYGFIGGGTAGFQLGNHGAYFFVGYGYTSKGAGFSATYSNSSVTPGWQTSVNGSAGLSGGGSFHRQWTEFRRLWRWFSSRRFHDVILQFWAILKEH